MKDGLISIVVIEYYSADEIVRCIQGIQSSLLNKPYEIIISSNSCYDNESKGALRARFPGTQICFNDYNGGFAYGMNRGLEKANGEFLVITNPDVMVLSGFKEMIDFLANNQDVGAIGPQMQDSSGMIQDSYRDYVSVQGLLLRHFKRIFSIDRISESHIDHNVIQTVDWLSGAFILTTRAAYNATGGMDERYFLYAEDLDWCTRIRKKGFEIVYFPPMKAVYSGTRIARKLNNYTWIFIKSHFRYWSKFGFFSGYPKRNKKIFN